MHVGTFNAEREREREREREQAMLTTLRYHSTKVACQRRGAVAIATYSGPMCANAFTDLRPRVVQAATGAACLVLRMDKTLGLMGSVPVVHGYTHGATPGAVIVRPDQYEFWTAYAEAMRKSGIIRVVFPLSEIAMCRSWVDFQISQAAH